MVSWTNWTFGPWYAHIGRKHVWGVDLGPYDVVWERPAKTYHRPAGLG